MSKRVDFAKERRAQGRAFGAAVRDILGSIEPLAAQQGIDLQAQLKESSARTDKEDRKVAEGLQEPVVPLFVSDDEGHPDRIGSCVLVRVDAGLYAFTAAHVVDSIGSDRVFAPSEGRGGKLLPLPPCNAHVKSSRDDNNLDVAVLALPPDNLGPFQTRTFLSDSEIDEKDRPDDPSLTSFYLVLGYSASRTQVKVYRGKRLVHQKSFRCRTHPVSASEYVLERLSQADHIALDFDHNEIVVGGRRTQPPKLQGVSGGGIFHMSTATRQGPLVAIATQNRRNSRLVIGTRLKHFLAVARGLNAVSR
jgi:hypothetical protein